MSKMSDIIAHMNKYNFCGKDDFVAVYNQCKIEKSANRYIIKKLCWIYFYDVYLSSMLVLLTILYFF